MLFQNSSLSQFYKRPLIIWTFIGAAILKGVAYLCIPFMTIFLFKNTGLPPYVIGTLVGLHQFGSMGASFFSGIISDRLGRRLVLFLGLYGGGLIYILFFLLAFALNETIGSIILFGFLNIIAGVAYAFCWPTIQALLSDQLINIERIDRATVFQHYYIVINLGSTIGPLVGAYLGIASNRCAFIITAILYLSIATLFWRITRNTKFTSTTPTKNFTIYHSINRLVADRKFLLFILAMFFFILGYSQIDSNLSYIIANRFEDGTKFFSQLFMVNALCMLIFQPIVRTLNRYLSFRQIIMSGSLIFFLSCILFFGHGHTKIEIIYLLIACSLAESMVIPIANAMVDEIAPAQMRGSYFSSATLRNLGKMVGPMIGGSVIMFLRSDYLFIFMGLCGIIAAVVIFTINE